MAERGGRPVMPSDVDPQVTWFDRFAAWASATVSRAWFFTGCVGLIVVWSPTFLVLPFDTYQLLINTATTIVTFLLVALLQNGQTRADAANQHKLNAMAAGLAELMQAHADGQGAPALADAVCELRAAVGLEERESA
jgi:hypothetical protein